MFVVPTQGPATNSTIEWRVRVLRGWCGGKLWPGYSIERESGCQPIGGRHSTLLASHWSRDLSARDRRAQVIALQTRESNINI